MAPIHDDEYKALTTELKRIRTQKAFLTQKQMAEKLGKPQSYVSKYESGERRLDVVELVHITQALGISYKAVLKKVFKGK